MNTDNLIEEPFLSEVWLLTMLIGLHKKMGNKSASDWYQVYEKMKESLKTANRNSVIGMDGGDAVALFMDAGWRAIEIIDIESDYLPSGPEQYDRMCLWVRNNKVVRAIAG
jgi:hypothetical protein